MVAGAARIQVTFAVDADGLLSVEAREQSTGIKASVVVKPSYGLKDDEIATMLHDSMIHAQHDLMARRLREQQVEAQRVIEALGAALADDGAELLNEEERAGIEAALAKLVEISSSDNQQAIKAEVEALESYCAFYVERRMNANVRKAMSGHNVEEFE